MRHSLAFAFALFTSVPVASGQLLRETHALVPSESDTSWSPVLVDLTGDGHLDLVRLPGELLIGRGDGGFSRASQPLPPALADQRYRRIVPGDADGDGDLDLFAIGQTVGSPLEDRLFLNDGSGGFQDAGHLHPNGDSNDAAFGDVNGDGLPDLLMARWGSEPNALYLGSASGFIDASSQLPASPEMAYEAKLVDVDLDGDLDALVLGRDSTRPQTQLSLWLNQGDGQFVDAPGQLPLDPQPVLWIAVGDLNGDGAADVYLSSAPGRVWLNDGSGVFTLKSLASSPWSGLPKLYDADGDGDLDLMLIAGSDALLENDGSGNLTQAASDQFRSAVPLAILRDVALGDLDGDGDADALCNYNAPNRVHFNDGSGRYIDASDPHLPKLSELAYRVDSGDLDGDGDEDLVFGAVSAPILVAWNLGHGGFSELQGLGPAYNSASPFTGDYDGDGDIDLYIARSQNQLLLNDGCGVLIDVSDQVPNNVPKTRATATGDLNGDGHVDIYLGQQLRDGILFGDGSGGFTYNGQLALEKPTTAPTTAVALGDLEGDGDLDAFIASDVFGRPRLALNQGDGSFTAGPSLPGKQNLQPVGGVAMVDVDADGDLDLVLATTNASFPQSGSVNDLWINQGNLVFTKESHRLPPIVDTASGLEVADFDADGDLDLYIPNEELNAGAPDTMLLNDGRGFFADAASLPGPKQVLPHSRGAVAADFDGDGDVDVVNYTPHEMRVFYNHTHQLAWARLPRIGEPASMRVTGQPGERWMVVAAGYPNPATCGLGALGARKVVAEGVLPASGEAVFEVGLDPSAVLWRVIYTGLDSAGNRKVRTLGNLEFTVPRPF